MNKRISVLSCVLITVFCVIATFQITFVYCNQRARMTEEEQTTLYNREKLEYIDQIYQEYFVGDIDSQTLTDALIDGYLTGAGERFGTYLTEDEVQSYTDSMKGDAIGIGVSVIYDQTDGLIEIISVYEDSPAQRAGVLPGDFIYAVDGETVTDLGYYGAVAKVRGEEGSELTLTVERRGAEITHHDYVMKREKFVEQSVYAHMYADAPIGIIKITGFNTATVEQFKEALAELQTAGAEAMVFDLRNNPGGELNSITSILDFILPEGDIISTIDKDGNAEVIATSDAACLDMPMAVLTNGGTASAAELFAGCIRDYDLGPLIGENTYGKGTMQTLLQLPDGSAVSITYRKFASASGETHDGVGFAPDIEVKPSDEIANKNPFKVTDDEDNILAEAIKYLTVEISND